jgi:hypothetical protein
MSSATLNAMTTPEKVVSPAGSVTADRDSLQTNTIVGGDAEAQPKKSAELATNPLDDSAGHDHPLAQLSQARKNFLLLIFSIASFVDICNVSGVAVAVAQISSDIGLDLSQIVWIITSYSLTFASVLLFAGRLADLFPAQIVFEAGFLALGIISLVTSFVTSSKFGFLILRGIGGICGAMSEWRCLARSRELSWDISSSLARRTLLILRSHSVCLPLARAHVPEPQGAAGQAGPPRHVWSYW